MIPKEMQTVLIDSEEPFRKKIIIANNIYKCSELKIVHKEVFLLKWALKYSNQDYEECWKCINNWLRSTQFINLNKKDINREDFISIIELIQENLLIIESIKNSTTRTVFDSILLLINNDVFQHYFKYNVDIYCKLISAVLYKIDCSEYLKEFLEIDIFNKNILADEKFHKHFLADVLPRLIECLEKFDSVEIFNNVSTCVQKCLFYRNRKSFKMFIDCFFQDVKLEKKGFPKSLMKYILQSYRTNQYTTFTYKIIFHAFCAAYAADFELIYKFFILLVHTAGFNLKDKLILSRTTKLDLPKLELSLIKSQEVILVLLDVLNENKNDLNFEINNVKFTEFIRNIVKQFLFLNTPSSTCYNIFLKAVSIDPLLIEPIIDDIIIYAMISDNHEHKELYELFIINIFDIYSKLRRVENFISKMVHTLNAYFNGYRKALTEVYKFNGEIDTECAVNEGKHKVDGIFTENILQHFSKCICNLASWQVINVFKTLLHQLRQILDDIDKNDRILNFMEILSMLLSTFLCSIRIADHAIVTNVVGKLLKVLEEMRTILQQFGMILLNREHNQKLMRSFLNIAYYWAEVYISLEYYSINNEVQSNKLIDNNFTACNITYLHSYLTVKQWCLISERITNFGEVACKQLLEKLYIQKLRAMLLFEKSVNDDIVQNVIKNMSVNIEIMWKNILEDKYVISNLLKKMNASNVLFIAEKLVNNVDTLEPICNKPHITSSSLLVTAVNYVVITKINKLLTKKKEKTNNELLKKVVSARIASMFTEDNFLRKEPAEIIGKARALYYPNYDVNKIEWHIDEEKVCFLFQILEKFPVIFCSEIVQQLYLMYICSLHRDLTFQFKKGNYKKLQIICERLVTGILQHSKFKLADLFSTTDLCNDVVENYDEWEHIFHLITENVFKDERSIEDYESIVLNFTEKMLTPVYMRCCIVTVNIANKIKKMKMSKNIKNAVERYKSIICDKVLDVILQNEPTASLIDGYSLALKYFLFNNDEKLSRLLVRLHSYVDLALRAAEHSDSNLTLFITILENKVKVLAIVEDDFSLNIWNAYKEKDWICSETDKLPHLVKIILGLTSNEEFIIIITDLLQITEESVAKKDYQKFTKKLNVWESVLSCDLNPVKIKKFQSALEKLLQHFITLLQHSTHCETLYRHIFNIQKTIIHAIHLPLSPPIIDMLILSITLLYDVHWEDGSIFNLSIALMESLLKYRKPLIMDRLPCFSHIYRILLRDLCERGDTNLNLEAPSIKEISDHSHQLEKFTKNLVVCQKDMARIAMYLIADILQQYEQVTLQSNVKIHLNNCIYSLLSVCDQHAIAFLMRALSSASTELFKDMYENYKKFYRFTGKV